MLDAIVEAGGKADQVIRTRIMSLMLLNGKERHVLHGEVFSKIKPACTFVEVKGFIDPRWKVETEADCVIA